jgi:hypothetical protein
MADVASVRTDKCPRNIEADIGNIRAALTGMKQPAGIGDSRTVDLNADGKQLT